MQFSRYVSCVFPQARQIPVTTDDSEVKAQLREFGEPICKLSALMFLCMFPNVTINGLSRRYSYDCLAQFTAFVTLCHTI